MSEPYHAVDRPLNLPERLEIILKILSDYHQQVIQQNTLPSQNPMESLTRLRAILAKKGDALEDFLKWRVITPEAQQDEELMACIRLLSPNLDPVNPKVSVLAPRWCSLMFKEYPMSVKPEHILRLIENSGYESEDGDEA